MNTIVGVINDRIKELGVTQAHVSRKISMDPDLLGRTLHGTRKLKADEFVSLCQVLGLTLEDFETDQAS